VAEKRTRYNELLGIENAIRESDPRRPLRLQWVEEGETEGRRPGAVV